jgi:hypothetical protein
LVIPGQQPKRYLGSPVVATPYAFPVYIGGGYDGSYAPQPAEQQQQPNVIVVYPPQPAPVIVNQFGSRAADQMAADAGNPEPLSAYQPDQTDQPSPDHYLIALKDHTVYSVVAYWVDGDTLNYFTAGNVRNQVSLSLVDRDLTARLSKESGMEVKLPAAK